jgi:hypothetical protein
MINDSDQELSSIRQESLNAYLGEKTGDERDGRSQYVTMEVLEAIEWALPSLLRTFTAGDKIVTFDPVGPEDEAQAEQETDIVNHYLLNENNGFLTFYEWFKDALMYPNGYAKIYTEKQENVTTEYYDGLDSVQLMLLDEDDRVEIVEATEDGEFFNVKLKITDESPVLRFEAVPPEQVLIDNDHNRLSLEGCEAICHKVRRSKSYLLKAGYDPKKLEHAVSEADEEWNDERINRLDTEDEYPDNDSDHEATKTYWLEEWYLHYDFDGDGIAERRKVDYIGGEIFENIELDYQPICALSCIPMTHRHSGMSLSDIVRPIQKLSTYFRRGINDNIAAIIEPRKYINSNAITEDGATLDQLLDPNSTVIETRDVTGIVPEQHQPVISELIQAHQVLESEKQVRSGIAPNLSLDPAVLQQSTMGGFTAALQEASQRIELIARVFAETGVKDAMAKAHRQIKEYQDKPKVLRIRGQWVETNPRDWKDRSNVTVNVGLGFNNKEKQIGVLTTLLEIQKEALDAGIATPENIYNTLEQLIEAAGLKQVDRYFTNPKEREPKEPQPDPMLMVAQQQLQMQGQKDQAELQLKARDQQFKASKEAAEMKLKEAELQLKAQREEKELLIKEKQGLSEAMLKQAQTYKTTEEGKRIDLETDTVLNGIAEQTREAAEIVAALSAQIEAAEGRESQTAETINQLQSMLAQANAPKRVVRNEAGDIIGTEVIQ